MRNENKDFHKEFNLEIKSIEPGGRFKGYASIFGYVDNHNDMVMPGAFANTLHRKSSGRDIKLLWQHDAANPIGYFDVIREDEIGLYVEGQLQLEVQKAREAYSLLKSGAIGGLSIGYNVVDAQVDASNGVRMILTLDLHEISLVTFPANELAMVAEVKSEFDNITAPQIIALSDALDEALFNMGKLIV